MAKGLSEKRMQEIAKEEGVVEAIEYTKGLSLVGIKALMVVADAFHRARVPVTQDVVDALRAFANKIEADVKSGAAERFISRCQLEDTGDMTH